MAFIYTPPNIIHKKGKAWFLQVRDFEDKDRRPKGPRQSHRSRGSLAQVGGPHPALKRPTDMMGSQTPSLPPPLFQPSSQELSPRMASPRSLGHLRETLGPSLKAELISKSGKNWTSERDIGPPYFQHP